MKPRPTQFGARENTASSRQHAPRLAVHTSFFRSELSVNTPENESSFPQVSPTAKKLDLSLSETGNRTTGGTRENASDFATDLNSQGKRSATERPLTCQEAAELVRVHPKTVRRMAGRGELPGHFRFGRWFFYASELDCWMRTELHSSRHSCR